VTQSWWATEENKEATDLSIVTNVNNAKQLSDVDQISKNEKMMQYEENLKK